MKLTLPTILILTVLTQPLFGQNALGDFHAPKLMREALINTMIEQPDGKILIGGDVNYFNDAPIGSIVRVQANGELDNTFSFTFDEEGCYAADMALRTSGDVFVLMRQLNRFSTVQRDKSWIVKLGANGSVVQKISTLPYARTMAMQGDGKIVVGAGQPRPLARYNADLSEDNAFNTAVTLDGWIDDIEISGNKIYLLGGFQHVNGVAKATVVRLDADGSVDTAFDLGGSKITQAQDFTVLPDGKLIFGGFARYTFPDATIKAPLFRINADGSLDDTFQLPPLEPFNSYFYGPVVASAVGYYVQFRVPAGDANIIRIKSDATVDKTFNPVPLDNRSEYDPYMIASATGLIVANVQTSISKYNIFRTSSTGDLVEAFAPPIARVGAIHHSDYANGKILIGGDFIKIDGHDTYRVARLNPDGTVDNTFTVPEHHGIAAQVKILGDNNVLIKTERGFFKFDAQGDTYPGFSWTSGAGNLYYVEKFKVLPNGMIMAVDANTLARLHADGSVDESFSIHRMGDMGSTAVAFDMQGDNAIYGTLFDGVQGMPANNLARITPQGEADPTFNVGGGPQFVVENPSQAPWPSINMIKVLDNGEVLAGGIFNRFDGKVIAHSLVKLSRDGTLIEAFNTNHSAQDLWGGVLPNNAQIEQAGSKLYIVATPLLYALATDGTVNPDFTPPVTVDLATSIILIPDAEEPSGVSLVATGLFVLPDGSRVSMIKLITTPDEPITGIPESTSAALSARVYPNPANETLNIDLGQEQGTSRVALFDLSGTKLTEYQVNNTGTPSTLDVSTIAPGYYVLKIASASRKTAYVKIALTR